MCATERNHSARPIRAAGGPQFRLGRNTVDAALASWIPSSIGLLKRENERMRENFAAARALWK